MTIYERIKQRREELHMTQEELAEKVGYVSASRRSTIAKIEAGTNDITQSQIVKFAEALKCKPGWLMGWDKTEVQMNKSDALIESRIHAIQIWSDDKSLTPEEKIILKEHFAEFLIRYKNLIENSVSTLKSWSQYSEKFNSIKLDTDPDKLKELYLRQDLNKLLEELSSYVNILPILLSNPSKELKEYFGIDVTDKKDAKKPKDIFEDKDIPMAASGLTSTTELSNHNKTVIAKHYNKNKK